MKQIERTFSQKVSRYLYPTIANPFITFKTFILYSLWAINPIVHILFIQKLVGFIEQADKILFTQWIIYYIVYNIIYEILDWSCRKWGWVENINLYRVTIHTKYITSFVKLDGNITEGTGTGKLVSIITKGSDVWALSLDDFLREVIYLFYALLFSCYMVFQFSVLYGILFLLAYIGVYVLGVYLNDISLSHRRIREQYWHGYVNKIVRIIMSKFEVLQTNKVYKEIKRLDEVTTDILQTNRNMATSVHLCYRVAEAFISWSKLMILFFVGMLVISGEQSMAFFVGLFGMLTLMDSTVTGSMKFFRNFTKTFTTIENMWNFFDSTPEIQGYDTGKEFKHDRGEIEIKKLNYGYNKDNNVFTDFSLKIPGEQVTAIVGVSGGGKSTLVKLISGYIRADSGEIIIDGQKLSEVSLKSYYKDIGYLTQEPSVFDGTIMENLCYALDKTPSKKKLDEIIKLAKCEFVNDFPDGLETEIGEKGIRLSGGQRQRLAIAKIFLKDPKIIILDEPTSALDSFSEEQITIAMHNLFKGRTVIIIAHRLQTVKSASDIILIEDGEIKERGTHEQLVKKKGVYKKMLDLQSGF